MEQENLIAAYAAGIFDGEGSVDIYNATPAKASKSPSFMLRVTIVQKDGKVMNWLQEHFSGYVGVDYHSGHYIHRWDVRSQAARKFLLRILPFVLIKRPQAILALEFEERKQKYLTSLKGSRGFRKLTDEEIKWRYEMKEELKRLKRDYAPYTKDGAPTTTKRKDN